MLSEILKSLISKQCVQPKNSTSFDLSIFLFKPQAWYVITRQRVWYRRRRMESPKVHFLRLDSIPSCNGFHTMLCIDSIHAFGVIGTLQFKPKLKVAKTSFLSPLHQKKRQVTHLSFFVVKIKNLSKPICIKPSARPTPT